MKDLNYEVFPALIRLGDFYSLINIYFGMGLFYIVYLLIYASKRLKGIEKLQLQYFIVGSIVAGFLMLITNAILPLFKINNFVTLPGTFSIIFTFATYHAIVKYKLFSIRTIILNILKYFILGFLLFLIVLTLRIIKDKIFHLNIYSPEALIVDGVVAIFVGINVEKVINLINERLQKIIKPEVFYIENLKNKLEEEIKNNLSFSFVISNVYEKIQKSFIDAEIFFFHNFEKDWNFFPTTKKISTEQINEIMSIKEDYIFEELLNDKKIEYKNSSLQNLDMIFKLSDKIFLLISKKKSGEAFTRTEIDILKESVGFLKKIFKMVELYDEVENFNRTLQKNVNEATKQLKNKVAALEEARRRERDMIDIMGHELRTPISIIKTSFGFFEMLLQNPNPDPKKIEIYKERIKENIDRQVKLIDTLLKATKIDKKKLELVLEEVDPIDVIDDSIVGQEKLAEKKGLKLIFEKPLNWKTYPRILADRARIQEVMDNLLSNAVKYTDKGSVTIKITHDENFAKISVIDTGIGIPKEAIKNLGKKFYRVKQYTEGSKERDLKMVRAGGTGLGLYVTFGLVRAHGGEITVESKVNEGSTFSFTVPLFKGKAKDQSEKELDMFKRKNLVVDRNV